MGLVLLRKAVTVEKDLSESEGGTEGNDDKEKETGASRGHSLLSVSVGP